MSQQAPSGQNNASAAKMKREAQKHLLTWIGQKTGAQVFDCDRSFDDGALFCLLVRAYDESLIDINRVTKDARCNLEMAFSLIEQHLHIPRMLAVEDMTHPDINARPDEQCIMTYLSQFPEAFLRRPTPQAMSVTDIQLPEFPSVSNVPSYEHPTQPISSSDNPASIQGNFRGDSYPNLTTQGNTAGVPKTDSLSSHPSISNMGGTPSLVSQSSFPQPPVTVQDAIQHTPDKSSSRYVLGGDLPLPPTVESSALDNQNPPTTTPPFGKSQSFAENTSVPKMDSFTTPPSQPQIPGYLTGNSTNQFGTTPQPQRPPPPSSGFDDFMSSVNPNQFASQAPPSRPPPPSGFEGMSFNTSQSNPNLHNPAHSNSSPGLSDWQQKELELKQREEAFRKQQEEFARQKALHEQEMEKLRQQAMSPPSSNPAKVEELQQELNHLRQNIVTKLKIDVIAARNLIPGSITGKRDPYAIVIVNNYKEQTSVVKRNIHPTWNQDFSFFIEDPNWTVNVTIYDKNTLKHDDFLGKVVIPIKQLKIGARREEWITLQPKKAGATVSGEIRLGLLLTQ